MRKLFRFLIIISGIAFAITIAISVLSTSIIKNSVIDKQDKQTGAMFYIAALIPTTEPSRYYARAIESMKKSAKSRDAILQCFEYEPQSPESEIIKKLQMIKMLEPDGIVVSIPQNEETLNIISEITELGIPIVTLESDLASSSRAAYVGTNFFSLGALACEAVELSFPHGAKTALFLSRDYSESSSKSTGIVSGFRQRAKQSQNISLDLILTNNERLSSNDEIIRYLLAEHQEIDVAIFIGARDAEGAARALIEYNKVGEPTIIGFDDDPSLLELIDLGVVSATIARFPEKSGAEAINIIMSLVKGERANAYVDPGLQIIRRNSNFKKNN